MGRRQGRGFIRFVLNVRIKARFSNLNRFLFTFMKKLFSVSVLCLSLAFAFETSAQNSSSFNAFWANFKAAVNSANKQVLSDMIKYPLDMPYGQRSVKNKAEFIRRYRDVFDEQLEDYPVKSAKKCFANATPEKDGNAYIVACNEVVIYRFVFTAGKWKLSGVDNINE